MHDSSKSSLVGQIEVFFVGIEDRSPEICGNAPDWILDFLLEKRDVFFGSTPAYSPDERMVEYVAGACRYITDLAIPNIQEDCSNLLDLMCAIRTELLKS